MKNKIRILNKIKPFKKIIEASGDKSISIRSILLASQAIGTSRIYNLLWTPTYVKESANLVPYPVQK